MGYKSIGIWLGNAPDIALTRFPAGNDAGLLEANLYSWQLMAVRLGVHRARGLSIRTLVHHVPRQWHGETTGIAPGNFHENCGMATSTRTPE
jgi:hypothetical protein